jgi:hypothetical protein
MRCVAFLLSASFFLLSAPSVAPAQNGGEVSQEEALARDAASYARAYGVSQDEAKRRLLLMANAGPEITALQQELGDNLAGAYFENRNGEFRLVLRTTEAQQRPKKKVKIKTKQGSQRVMPTDLDLDVEYVAGAKHSRKIVRNALRKERDWLRERLPELQGSGFDVKTGEVTLLVRGKAADETRIRAIGQELSGRIQMPVRVTVRNAQVSPLAMRGGSPTYLANGTPWCTTAFAARNPSNVAGILTAGHCDEAQVWREGTTSYALTGTSVFNQYEDFSFYRSSIAPEPKFVAATGEVRTLTGRRTKANTDEKLDLADPRGAYVCFYGRVTGPKRGQVCGEVNDVWHNPNYPMDASQNQFGCSNGPTVIPCEYNYVEVVPSGTSPLYCFGGDSGAPVFAYTIAFGILSGCSQILDASGNPTDSAVNLIYTSIDELYYYNYSLIYG